MFEQSSSIFFLNPDVLSAYRWIGTYHGTKTQGTNTMCWVLIQCEQQQQKNLNQLESNQLLMLLPIFFPYSNLEKSHKTLIGINGNVRNTLTFKRCSGIINFS